MKYKNTYLLLIIIVLLNTSINSKLLRSKNHSDTWYILSTKLDYMNYTSPGMNRTNIPNHFTIINSGQTSKKLVLYIVTDKGILSKDIATPIDPFNKGEPISSLKLGKYTNYVFFKLEFYYHFCNKIISLCCTEYKAECYAFSFTNFNNNDFKDLIENNRLKTKKDIQKANLAKEDRNAILFTPVFEKKVTKAKYENILEMLTVLSYPYISYINTAISIKYALISTVPDEFGFDLRELIEQKISLNCLQNSLTKLNKADEEILSQIITPVKENYQKQLKELNTDFLKLRDFDLKPFKLNVNKKFSSANLNKEYLAKTNFGFQFYDKLSNIVRYLKYEFNNILDRKNINRYNMYEIIVKIYLPKYFTNLLFEQIESQIFKSCFLALLESSDISYDNVSMRYEEFILNYIIFRENESSLAVSSNTDCECFNQIFVNENLDEIENKCVKFNMKEQLIRLRTKILQEQSKNKD
jgi:hypothetical protein